MTIVLFDDNQKNLRYTDMSLKLYGTQEIWYIVSCEVSNTKITIEIYKTKVMDIYFMMTGFSIRITLKNFYVSSILKLSFFLSGGYKGVNFNLPPEVSSGINHGRDRDCIDQMQDLELLDLERRFRDMGFLIEESESSERYVLVFCNFLISFFL